ncbi:hypothetical protein SAMN05444000_102280 [Shimia gijangensis]|uniref:Uncharacterized protein n=1 Tax=Shimia gijangensis TaxID=1470563 RepID=A0A1M6DBP5_9RHOB|nr:hypothetical protein [Shimia gijangensis]SHI70656.1 hypothetical protein SAMN05444000_102280 [Shimia gijangensis]
MKYALLSAAFIISATIVEAQSGVLVASPIPDNAEQRFCYYSGLAYSADAYVLLTGNNTVTETVRDVEERLLRCKKDDDGLMRWEPESTMQLGR